MNAREQYVVQLFVKAPVLAQVKTRMQPVLNQQEALQLHKELALCVCRNLVNSDAASVQVWASNDIEDNYFAELQAEFQVPVLQQQGKNLGARMLAAARVGLQTFKGVILVGGDCPFVDREYLNTAIAALDAGCDVVIGPARDGGYVLLGLNKVDEQLFARIDWGTEQVFSQTVAVLQKLQWSYTALDVKDDIDRAQDLLLLDQASFPQSLRAFSKLARNRMV